MAWTEGHGIATQAASATFGASDVNTLVAQLNACPPQLEVAVQQLRGAQMLIEARVQELASAVAPS
jgi:hypothetical protein